MFVCFQHNWRSEFSPCPACVTTVTSTTNEIKQDSKEVKESEGEINKEFVFWHDAFNIPLSKGDVYHYDFKEAIREIKNRGYTLIKKKEGEQDKIKKAISWCEERIDAGSKYTFDYKDCAFNMKQYLESL